jgi:CheY-like chemotaxis protein
MDTPQAEPVAQGTGPEEPRRVLVVDDNPVILDIIHKVLCPEQDNPELSRLEAELFGEPEAKQEPVFTMDRAAQGQEGYAKVVAAQREGRPYALAVVDMRMPPGWDGLETIERMLEVDPQLEVIICSAYSDYSFEEVVQRVRRPELAWLSKPFNGQQVLELARTLSERGLRRRQGPPPA